MIELLNVNKSFSSPQGPLTILQDINLKISKGETIAILGPSGSGKTTMLSLLGGLDTVDSGEIVFNNSHFYSQMSDSQLNSLRSKSIGIVFQNFHLIPSLTALENICLPMQLNALGNHKEKSLQILGLVGLESRQDHFPHQLSGGEKQRVALARALALSPELLLCDEPSGNLDSKTGNQVMDLLFDIVSSENITMALVTHDIQLANRCNRIVEIDNGHIK